MSLFSEMIPGALNDETVQSVPEAQGVYVFTAMDLEDSLIKYYCEQHHRLSWNLGGFGSNDPGRNRDKSRVKDDHFDSLYPIDLELPITHRVESFPITVADFYKESATYPHGEVIGA